MTRIATRIRRLRRSARERDYVNTINVRNRVTIDFVWYPGAALVDDSLVDTLVPDNDSGNRRNISFTWQRDGGRALRRPMLSGRGTISLPPGSSGELSCFGSSWRITRVGNAVNMEASNTLRGVQRRLDRLGYHLRRPGSANSGIDNNWGKRSELAVLQFQNDYRPSPGAPANAGNRLKVRGEWTENTDAAYTGNLQRYNNNTAVAPNPSTADGQSLQASLVARVGG